MSWLLILAGVVLSCYGAFMVKVSNFNLGVVMTCAVACCVLFWGIFYKKIKDMTKSGALKWVKYAVILGACIEAVLVGFLGLYGNCDNVTYNEDAVIVLGAGVRGDRVTVPLARRLDEAVKYHKQNPDALIVVTGGQGYQESVTEASAMEKYLLERGVSGGKIIKEEKATSTNENMRFSKEILDGYFKEDYSIVVITNKFHIYRGVEIAKTEGFEQVTHKGASIKWYNVMPCYLRESLAVLKMWVFD